MEQKVFIGNAALVLVPNQLMLFAKHGADSKPAALVPDA